MNLEKLEKKYEKRKKEIETRSLGSRMELDNLSKEFYEKTEEEFSECLKRKISPNPEGEVSIRSDTIPQYLSTPPNIKYFVKKFERDLRSKGFNSECSHREIDDTEWYNEEEFTFKKSFIDCLIKK